MPFKKGCAPGPGRPIGSVTIKTYLRTAQVLANAERHPIIELIKLADESKDIAFKRELWLTILSFTEVPQRDPIPLVSQNPDESKALVDARWKEANERAKPPTPTTPPAQP